MVKEQQSNRTLTEREGWAQVLERAPGEVVTIDYLRGNEAPATTTLTLGARSST